MWLILTMNGNLVGVLARHRAEHAEGRGDGVAAALDGELDDVLGVEVDRVRREGRGAGVLDALVDRQDRDVAGAGRAAVVIERLERTQDLRVAVGLRHHPVDEVGTWKVKLVLGDAGALIVEE